MKRLIILFLNLVVAATAVLPVVAQDNGVIDAITLNDATPSIDVVITLPPDTTGSISLSLSMAAVKMLDQHGGIVFEAADPRIHMLELNIAPNTGTHTLVVERLPNISQAYVKIASLPELTNTGVVTEVTSNTLNQYQGYTFPVTSTEPAGDVSFSIPDQSTGVITASFLGMNAVAQFEDDKGTVLAISHAHVDGLNIVLDGGTYKAAILAIGLTEEKRIGVQLVPVDGLNFALLPTSESPAESVAGANNVPCKATVTAISANLRSGPGTGYSVLNYTQRGQTLMVGGTNPEQNWIVVAASEGTSAWLSRDLVQLEGVCSSLTVFNIPLRNAPPVTIQVVPSNPDASNLGGREHEDHDDDDHDEHDDHDDDEGDHD